MRLFLVSGHSAGNRFNSEVRDSLLGNAVEKFSYKDFKRSLRPVEKLMYQMIVSALVELSLEYDREGKLTGHYWMYEKSAYDDQSYILSYRSCCEQLGFDSSYLKSMRFFWVKAIREIAKVEQKPTKFMLRVSRFLYFFMNSKRLDRSTLKQLLAEYKQNGNGNGHKI